MASQESNVSSTSVPPEILENEDPEFVAEISNVDALYFSNVENFEPQPFRDDQGDSDSETEENSYGQEEPEVQTGRLEDENESSSLHDFQMNGCGCSKIYGHPCFKEIPWENLADFRSSCLEYSKDELDLVIKVELLGHRRNGEETHGLKHKSRERQRSFQEYFLFGKQVCLKTFCFAHGISHSTLKRIGNHLDSHGISVRKHGNAGKSPKHALTISDMNSVISFLNSYANKNGLPLPGRMQHYRNAKVVLLPSDKTKADIYEQYNSVAPELGLRKISQRSFYRLWHEHCPTLLIIKPASDLCLRCQKHSVKLSNGGNLTEEEKLQDLRDYNEHISKAKLQRDYYRSQVEDAKTQYTALPDDKKQRGKFSISANSQTERDNFHRFGHSRRSLFCYIKYIFRLFYCSVITLYEDAFMKVL